MFSVEWKHHRAIAACAEATEVRRDLASRTLDPVSGRFGVNERGEHAHWARLSLRQATKVGAAPAVAPNFPLRPVS
jgi:hypothetical protein